MALSEVARTLSQCRGLSLGFAPSTSSASSLPEELAPPLPFSRGFVISFPGVEFVLRIRDCGVVNTSDGIRGTLDSELPDFLGVVSGGGGGGGGGAGIVDVSVNRLVNA